MKLSLIDLQIIPQLLVITLIKSLSNQMSRSTRLPPPYATRQGYARSEQTVRGHPVLLQTATP